MGWGVGSGSGLYVCVIQYMHAVGTLSTVFDGDVGVGWEVGSGSGICMCVTFITCMQCIDYACFFDFLKTKGSR